MAVTPRPYKEPLLPMRRQVRLGLLALNPLPRTLHSESKNLLCPILGCD